MTRGLRLAVAMVLAPHVSKRVPAVIVGLLGGVLMYWVLAWTAWPELQVLQGNAFIIGPLMDRFGPYRVMSSLFLSLFIMTPTLSAINDAGLQPYMDGDKTAQQAWDDGLAPLRDFMLKQTRERDLALFVELAKLPRPEKPEDVPMRAVIPAYAISELKTGFQMGFFLFVPFLLIDLVVSTTLLSMGMLQLPPAMISLPFKILLFVMIDGWNLLVASLVRSFM